MRLKKNRPGFGLWQGEALSVQFDSTIVVIASKRRQVTLTPITIDAKAVYSRAATVSVTINMEN